MQGISPDQFAKEVISAYMRDERKGKPERIEQSYVEREKARRTEQSQQEQQL
jgi:hypothetical protein